MKSLLLALAAAVVGIAAGLATAWWRCGSPSSGDPFDLAELHAIDAVDLPAPEVAGHGTRVVVTHKEGGSKGTFRSASDKEFVFDFGLLPQMTAGSAEFLFRNDGDFPLELKKGRTTCQCTLSELSEAHVAPGEAATVKVNWKTEGPAGPYRHTADILTNDPQRPEVHLVVTGNLARNVQVEPYRLFFGRFNFRSAQQREFTMLAFHSVDFKVQDFSLVGMTHAPADSSDPPTMDDPLARNMEFARKPLTPEELRAADPQAKSGYRVTVSLKPGLPLGRFERRIRVATNLLTPTYVDVAGAVIGDIAVAESGDWIPSLELFQLGEADGASGISKPLFLIVGGATFREVQVKVKKTSPPELKAKIGTPEPGNGIVRWPMTISIPPGTPVMSHADKGEYGEVVVETTHPEQKELVIPVSFLVVKPRQ